MNVHMGRYNRQRYFFKDIIDECTDGKNKLREENDVQDRFFLQFFSEADSSAHFPETDSADTRPVEVQHHGAFCELWTML